MEITETKAETFIPLSKELKKKRETMGLSQVDIIRKIGGTAGNYSKMENGLVNPANALEQVNRMFNVWIGERIEFHKSEVKRLEEIK